MQRRSRGLRESLEPFPEQFSLHITGAAGRTNRSEGVDKVSFTMKKF